MNHRETTEIMRIATCSARVAIACSLAFSIQAQSAEVCEPTMGWSTVQTDLEIRIDPDKRSMSVAGKVKMILDGAASSIGPTLGLNSRGPQMIFESGECAGAEVRVGLRHPTRTKISLAQVRFPAPKTKGTEVEFSFRCVMKKPGNQIAVGPGMAFASWVEAWYPMPMPPAGVSLGGASRAKGVTRFVLPKGWSAVTNGHLVSHEDQADRTVEVWRTERALSRSFAAGPFRRAVHEADGLTARLYLLTDASSNPQAHVRALARAIRSMEKRLGPYPFKTFSIAEVPPDLGSFGASSEQGFILVKPYFLRVAEGNLPLFAHEAAHAWWGNTVGSDGPAALMCSEALAQYGAVLAIEDLEGAAAATEFLRFSRAGYILNQSGRGYFDLIRRGWDVPLNKISQGFRQGHRLSDSKGHWVYHMLRRRVGDEMFFATLRGLIRRFDGALMSLEHVREAFVAAAPDARLKQFFSQWLDRTGAPEIQARLAKVDGVDRIDVRQVQGGAPFEVDLELDLLREGQAAIRTTVRVTKSAHTFPLEHGGIHGVVIDPDHRLLIWHPKYGMAPSAVQTDVELTPAERALYVGSYRADVDGRRRDIDIVARGSRISIVVGDAPAEEIRKIGEHRFQAGNGVIRFEIENGKAGVLEFVSGARKVRARRR